MKFEKINDNKMKIIFTKQDLIDKNIDILQLNKNSFEVQEIFWDILHEAEKDYDFDLAESQLLVEGAASSNGTFVITVTKIGTPTNQDIDRRNSKLKIKRKTPSIETTEFIYSFRNFEDLISFSERVFPIPVKYSNNLYQFNNVYYLVFTNIQTNVKLFKKITTLISDYAEFIPYSDIFKRMLDEKGLKLINKNTIKTIYNAYVKKV